MTKREIAEMCDDVAAYSGNVMGFGRVKQEGGDTITGTVKTSLGAFRFRLFTAFNRDRQWFLHFESPTASLESGGISYEAYIVPRFSAHPGLRDKIAAANFIIATLTSSQKLYRDQTFRALLRAAYAQVDMPRGLARHDRVTFCRSLKRSHLPDASRLSPASGGPN